MDLFCLAGKQEGFLFFTTWSDPGPVTSHFFFPPNLAERVQPKEAGHQELPPQRDLTTFELSESHFGDAHLFFRPKINLWVSDAVTQSLQRGSKMDEVRVRMGKKGVGTQDRA